MTKSESEELAVVSNAASKRNDLETPQDAPAIPDIAALMAEIRARVKADAAQLASSAPTVKPFVADSDGRASRRAGELVHSEDLRYLNMHYAYSVQALSPANITSHRPGIVGRLIVKVKRKFLNLLWEHLLKNYFEQEREFQTHLVRYLNDTSKYVDARDASNFWELIRKIDYDITKALERIERVADEQNASLRTIERGMVDELNQALGAVQRSIASLATTGEQHGDALRVLDSVTRGLESIVSRLHVPEVNASTHGSGQGSVPDYSYVLLENRYRGAESEIARRLSVYPPVFSLRGAPVLEIGAGRGELQKLLRDAGIASYGVDTDKAMVETATERGFDVRLENGIHHLAALPPKSLSGVIAIQVVEHLNRDALQELIRLAVDRTKEGGKIVFETINPKSVLALSSNYFRDITHVMPLHPDTLAYLLSLAGCEIEEVKMLSPVPEAARLRSLPTESFMTPRWARTVELFNHNIRVLNDLLFGDQDFAIVARVRPQGRI